MAKPFIVFGSYESPLYGFTLTELTEEAEDDTQTLALAPTFAYCPHSGSVRALAASNQWLVSASSDDSVKVYDLSTQQELGVLTKDDNTVTALAFHTGFLFCGSERGKITIYSTGNWEEIEVLKGHKDRINSIAVHPTGKMALSVSRDKTMKLWDLKNGKIVHNKPYLQAPDLVVWNPSGTHYAVLSDRKITVHRVDGTKVRKFEQRLRINDVCFITDVLLAFGGEEKSVSVFDIGTGNIMYSLTRFDNRVKGIATIRKTWQDENVAEDHIPYIVTISSDEMVRVWDLESNATHPIAQTHVDVRMTCLVSGIVSMAPPIEPTPMGQKERKEEAPKRKRKRVDSDEEQVAPPKKKRKHQMESPKKLPKPQVSKVAKKHHNDPNKPLKSILKRK